MFRELRGIETESQKTVTNVAFHPVKPIMAMSIKKSNVSTLSEPADASKDEVWTYNFESSEWSPKAIQYDFQVSCLKFHSYPGMMLLVAGLKDGSIKIIMEEEADGSFIRGCVSRITHRHRSFISRVECHPVKPLLLSCSHSLFIDKGEIKMWNIQVTGSRLQITLISKISSSELSVPDDIGRLLGNFRHLNVDAFFHPIEPLIVTSNMDGGAITNLWRYADAPPNNVSYVSSLERPNESMYKPSSRPFNSYETFISCIAIDPKSSIFACDDGPNVNLYRLNSDHEPNFEQIGVLNPPAPFREFIVSSIIFHPSLDIIAVIYKSKPVHGSSRTYYIQISELGGDITKIPQRTFTIEPPTSYESLLRRDFTEKEFLFYFHPQLPIFAVILKSDDGSNKLNVKMFNIDMSVVPPPPPIEEVDGGGRKYSKSKSKSGSKKRSRSKKRNRRHRTMKHRRKHMK
jgi:WD40 repeat protein